MRRVAGLITAVVVVLGIVAFASVRAIDADKASAKPAPARHAAAGAVTTRAPAVTRVKGAKTVMRSLTAGGLKRSYEVIAPKGKLPKSAPVIVMLSGIHSSTSQEITRDRLGDYASAGQAEVVYPVAYGESWNAGGCCGKAAEKKIDDLAFLRAVVAAVDPGHARPAYVVGYSNGARLAYLVACDDPALFSGYAMVKGDPTAGCVIRKPVSLVQLASVDDPELPYKPGGRDSTHQEAVTTLIGQLRATEKCPATGAVTHSGTMTQTTWSGCAAGTRVALAAWTGGVHSFPRPPASVPSAAQVAWSFFTGTPIAPLPG